MVSFSYILVLSNFSLFFKPKMRILFFLYFSISCRLIDPDSNGNYNIRHDFNTDSFSWIVLGDWGGWPAPFYTTPIQLSVAESMTRTAKLYRPEYLVALGDNFYFWGVEDENDPHWLHTYEEVYPDLQLPWYPITGNHDWDKRPNINGEFVGGNGTAQLAYSSKSDRWTFPDFFYTIDSYLSNGMKQRIVMIDTQLLVGVYSSIGDADGIPPNEEYAELKWKWIEDTLEESTNFDYLFVAGHYMVIDTRGHYDKTLVARLLPLLKKYNVQGYIQGHRHTMEHVQGISYLYN